MTSSFKAKLYCDLWILLRSDQRFCNLKRKIQRQRDSSSYILLNVQNSPRDYLYKAPCFLTVCQNVFYIFLEYFSSPWIPHELMISRLLDPLNYACWNHLANNHTVQRSDEYSGHAIILLPSSINYLITSE